MNYKILAALLTVPFIVEAAPPQTATEAACTRSAASIYVGESFFFPMEYFSGFQVRKNKALWAHYNKFVDTKLIAGKKAVIECYEVVPGPLDLNQYVFSLKVDGFNENLFAETDEIIKIILEDKKNKSLNDELNSAIGGLSKYVGKYLWSTPINYGYEKYGAYFPEGGRLFKNLERVKVLKVESHQNRLDKKSVLMYVQTDAGEALFTEYSPKTALLRLEVDWYKENPQEMFAYSDWSDKTWEKIKSGNVELGMTGFMVKMAIGYPKDVNKTITSRGTVEQWVYEGYTKNRYYYFTNGILDAIQK